MVKSAARALQILEFFDDIQRSATAIEIVETLRYPQSSASALLHTLVDLGYLHYFPETHHYTPSNRVALLGYWVNPDLFAGGAMLRMMHQISQRTGDAVMLVTRQGLFAQYIHVIQATKRLRFELTLGAMLPLAASTSGYALLSTYPDGEVRKILSRINAEAPEADRVSYPALIEILAEIRRCGYCFKAGVTTPGGATISMPLSISPNSPPTAIGIAGVAEVMRANEEALVAILREEVATFLNSAKGDAPGEIGA